MELSQFKTVEQLAAAIKSLDMVTSVAWTDYSGTSTIVGWTSYTVKEIWYKKIGKLVFVQFDIEGTSDDTVATFTLPFNKQTDVNEIVTIRVVDDGTAYIGFLSISAAIVTCYSDIAAGAWINSGNKYVYGQFWYQTT